MIRRLAGLVAVLIAIPAFASDDSNGCGMYPAEVMHSGNGWSGCDMRKAGEKPLWHGLAISNLRQQVRFTFTQGHYAYTRIIDLDELADGTGIIRLRTLDHDRDEGLIVSPWKRRRLTASQVATINQLGASSGTWHHTIGTWDSSDRNEIYMHCETLDMERVTDEGYRYVSVTIGCNQPAKLMPLVKALTEMAGLKPSDNGTLY